MLCLCRCDDNAKVKEKMIYASSMDELKKRLVGIATEVQANDKSGFDMKMSSIVLSKFRLEVMLLEDTLGALVTSQSLFMLLCLQQAD